MVFASRRRAEAVALANSLTSRRVPSSISLIERTSARSKLISSPLSEAITSVWEVWAGLFASSCDLRSSIVRIDPVALRLAVATMMRAPCSCESTPARPPLLFSAVPASIENGMSAIRADLGAAGDRAASLDVGYAVAVKNHPPDGQGLRIRFHRPGRAQFRRAVTTGL